MFVLKSTPRSPANGGMLSGHWLRHMSPGLGRQAIYNRILADQCLEGIQSIQSFVPNWVFPVIMLYIIDRLCRLLNSCLFLFDSINFTDHYRQLFPRPQNYVMCCFLYILYILCMFYFYIGEDHMLDKLVLNV